MEAKESVAISNFSMELVLCRDEPCSIGGEAMCQVTMGNGCCGGDKRWGEETKRRVEVWRGEELLWGGETMQDLVTSNDLVLCDEVIVLW